MIKYLLLILLVFGLISGGIWLYFYQNKSDSSYPNYSSFAKVDESLYEMASAQAVLPELVDSLISINLLYPVSNIKDEIKRLIGLVQLRTESVINEHENEYDNILAIKVGEDKTINDYLGAEVRPLTNEVYRIVANDIAIIVANKKIQNDVARPRQMNLLVNTEVETPNTPSYPSLFAAKATAAGEVLSHFMKPEDYHIVAKAIEEAIARKQIVGVSTKFDTDYGTYISKEYTQTVFKFKESQEFLNLVREREWDNNIQPKPVNNWKVLPNLKPTNPTIVRESKNFIFKSNIENTGQTITPESLAITIEIDRYNDGSVDQVVEFPFGAVSPKETKEASYILMINWPGNHSARFLVNKNLDFQEYYHHDNYGEWLEFSVD